MKNPRNIVLVWDWNGTLVNDAFLFVALVNGYLSSYNLKNISIAEYKKNFCFPVSDYYKRIGFSLSKKEFQTLSCDFIEQYKKVMFSASLVLGAKKLLLSFSALGYRQFLLSAQEHSLLVRSVNYYNLTSSFVSVFGLKNNYAEGKTLLARTIYNKYCSNNDIVVFIGDTQHDFEVASAVGAHCCLVAYGHNSLQRLKSTGAFVAKDLEGVRSFIRQLIISH